MINIGARIKQLRELHNVSANKLSKELEVDPSTISKIEKGSAKPSLDLLEKLCNFFNITFSDFFDDNTNSVILTDELKSLVDSARNLTSKELIHLRAFIDCINERR